MVHALEEIRRLLKPSGKLINIYPVSEAPLVEVHKDKRVLRAEAWPVQSCFEDTRAAEAALNEVVQRRLYVIEDSSEFDFLIYGSSVAELRDFLTEADAYDDTPTDEAVAALRTEMYDRIDEFMRATGDEAEAVQHERARIARLKPIR